ncbi:exodeoxyribonuclease V subunit alpha [Algibacillus agarilyticus]|uniref:exodeoxyribonuclease V subunit alpha n=1 Tax=Algibacillus agarilyticus TaxID=2234133 RepID=UPI000DCFA958|nr:exodeoxyribonuclease V subunit alpha [Algibacillus agarilyticus]
MSLYPYSHYAQAQQHLEGINAIDFYLARQICDDVQMRAEAPFADSDHELLDILFHSIVLVSEQLRSGHTCILLADFAENTYWQTTAIENEIAVNVNVNVNANDAVNHTVNIADENNPHSHLTQTHLTQTHLTQTQSITEPDDESVSQASVAQGYVFPTLTKWLNALDKLGLTVAKLQSPKHEQFLVLQNKRLYLRRYWQFETELAATLNQRQSVQLELNMAHANAILHTLFAQPAQPIDWQMVAVANSLLQGFSIISGGPGTGKTTTVVKLLAALIFLKHQSVATNAHLSTTEPTAELTNESTADPVQPLLKIAMVAPTGKAAQRLSESISGAKHKLADLLPDHIIQQIPVAAQTVHRLLGIRQQAHLVKYHQQNPLDLDLLLLDEASMVDLPLMTRLFRALPAHCRVIMLGDADQLPSVAAGAVLADLAPLPHQGYSQQRTAQLANLLNIDLPASLIPCDQLTHLQVSYRFKGDEGIGLLAKAVINGQHKQCEKLKAAAREDVSFNEQITPEQLTNLVTNYIKPIFKAPNVEQAFKRLSEFRLLAAVRQTDFGVEALNQQIEQILRKKQIIRRFVNTPDHLYPGKPIMITQNDYVNNVFNGDIGLIWPNENKLMVAFEHAEGIRWISLARLPHFETVFAMTIHKTQGSEFDHVAIVLPENYSPILSRELLYTGITRAKTHISLYSDPHILQKTITKKVQRYSGLAERIGV